MNHSELLIKLLNTKLEWVGRVAQSVQRLATGCTVRGSNPGGDEIFRTCSDRPWDTPRLLYNGYRVFLGGKKRPGRDADSSPSYSAVVTKGQSYTSTPLWAVRPVKSLSACTRVHFKLEWIQYRLLCGLRRRSVTAWLLGPRVRNPVEAWIFVTCVGCVLCRQRPLRRGDHLCRVILQRARAFVSKCV